MNNTPATRERHLNSHWWLIVRFVLFGLPILAVVVWCGRNLGHDWSEWKGWIADSGFWGPIVLIAVTAVLTIFMFPDTPFSMAAGAVFGMGWGSLYALAGAILGASLAFWASRLVLRERVCRFLDGHPRWSAIEHATSGAGARLQFLIRLTPLHSASLSYVMGASRLAYGSFMIGCIGMIPGVMLEVYFGHVAGHIAGLASGTKELSLTHTIATIGGLLLAVVVMIYVTQLARQAIADSGAEINTSTATPIPASETSTD